MEKKYSIRTRALYKFLKKNRLFTKYIENIRKQHPYNREVIEYDESGDILKLLAVEGNIDHSFCWSGTPQGHKFWEHLDNREIIEYREHERIYNIMHSPSVTNREFVF
jgi:hypothetical protein